MTDAQYHGCRGAEEMHEEFQTVLREHLARYPLMEPQDCAKLAYQSTFGPAHAAGERGDVLRQLLGECSALPADREARPPERIGNGLCRVHLSGTGDWTLAAPLLADLLLLTAAEHHGTAADLEECLTAAEALPLPGMADWLAVYRRQGCPPVHHSPAYREAYDPHYRVLRTAYGGYFPALLAAARLARSGRPAVVAIDGRCGSGKSGLGDLMGRLLPCNVVHMDDYYLPPDRRAENWEQIPAGNMDLARFLQEVLVPAGAGAQIRCRPYDCRSGTLREGTTLPARPLTVVEGSYSQHPLLSARYDLRMFLTCAPEEQHRRLERREGAHFAAYESRWMPLEERYIRQCGPEKGCQLVIDTTEFFP